MITVIRKYQKPLMFIVAVLTIIAFAWLYNPAETSELGANVAARIYGRIYTPADVDRIARTYDLAMGLGLLDLVMGLGGSGPDGSPSISDYVVNVVVLRHEADLLGIQPTQEQIAERIRKMAPFLTGGQFDPTKFEAFVTERLGPRGMTTLSLEEVVRDAILFDRVSALVGSPAAAGSGELAAASRSAAPVDLVTAGFPSQPVLDSVSITEEQARDFFEKNAASLIAPESIQVEAAVFSLPESSAGLEGKERVTALQELAGRAAEFAAKNAGSDFVAAAKGAGAEVIKTPEFNRRSPDDSGLPIEVARGAFFLTEEGSVGDVTQAEDEFYVLRLAGRTPERPMTFEEARPMVESRLKQIEAEKILRDRAARAVAAIRSSLAGGQPMAEAFTGAGLTPVVLNGVKPSDPELAPEVAMAARVSTLLVPSQVSNPFPEMTGLGIVGVVSRADDKASDELTAQIVDGKRRLFFASWLESRRQAAHVTTPNRNRAPRE
ncbi:MAG: hypothetical protein Fur0032_10350 [Terrimicrobiaceae bacterium]